ncbi:hypothetical protein Gorai_019564, partial [Gossypium raimondii]|nr:hypothetical protein [Gossypium raimondii]
MEKVNKKEREKSTLKTRCQTLPWKKDAPNRHVTDLAVSNVKERDKGGINGDNTDERPSNIVRRRLVNNISPCKAVAGDQPARSNET